MSTPQKINIYYLGIVLGRKSFCEITAIIILRITLVIEEIIDAAT